MFNLEKYWTYLTKRRSELSGKSKAELINLLIVRELEAQYDK